MPNLESNQGYNPEALKAAIDERVLSDDEFRMQAERGQLGEYADNPEAVNIIKVALQYYSVFFE
ncbi:MAG: hypothetical protein M3Q81_02225 [bacterium]|nr:hypothetical protein [bacterium]